MRWVKSSTQIRPGLRPKVKFGEYNQEMNVCFFCCDCGFFCLGLNMFKPCFFACASSAYQDKLVHDKSVPIGSGQVASLSNGSVVVNTVFKVVGTWNVCNSAITVVSCFT